MEEMRKMNNAVYMNKSKWHMLVKGPQTNFFHRCPGNTPKIF